MEDIVVFMEEKVVFRHYAIILDIKQSLMLAFLKY